MRLLPVYILEILHNHSDYNHPLSQTDIQNYLRNQYDVEAGRKTLGRHLLDLIDSDRYSVEYRTEYMREVPAIDFETREVVIDPETGEPEKDEIKITGRYYMDHLVSMNELRLIIDALLSSDNISSQKHQDLINRVLRLTTRDNQIRLKSMLKHTMNSVNGEKNTGAIFRLIEILNEAIESERKVTFSYATYGTDLKLHSRKNADGTDKIFMINPYFVVAREGKYYLVCNLEGKENIGIFRLDRILNLQITEEDIKPSDELMETNGRPLDIEKYKAYHPFMVFGDPTEVVLRIPKTRIIDVVDVFGGKVKFFDEGEEKVSVSTTVAGEAAMQFAKRYAPDIMILQPESLAKQFLDTMKRVVDLYEDMEEIK